MIWHNFYLFILLPPFVFWMCVRATDDIVCRNICHNYWAKIENDCVNANIAKYRANTVKNMGKCRVIGRNFKSSFIVILNNYYCQ